MASQDIDIQLVREAKRGNKRAFDALVIKYQFKLVKLVGRYVYDSAEALDVVQESFIRAYRALPTFQEKSAFYSWIYRIALNTAKNHLASRSRRPQAADIDLDQFINTSPAVADNEDPEGLLMRDEVEEAVLHAVDKLSEDLRTAIVLREMAGLSYDEIAESVHCPVGTIRSRLHRAREAIISEVMPLLDKEGGKL